MSSMSISHRWRRGAATWGAFSHRVGFRSSYLPKGARSTWNKLPIQQDYRSPEEWKPYLSNVTAILQSKRPHLLASSTERFLSEGEVIGGHIYMTRE